jgi:hypothetical protein
MPTHHDYDADGTVRDMMLDVQEEQREQECKAAGEAAYRRSEKAGANPHCAGTSYYAWWQFGWARAGALDPKCSA